jgi:hypothetical protein
MINSEKLTAALAKAQDTLARRDAIQNELNQALAELCQLLLDLVKPQTSTPATPAA